MRANVAVGPGPYFLGQAIDLTVNAPGDGRPVVTPPGLAGAEVAALDRPGAGAGLRLVPRKAGLLVVPSLTVKAGGRVARTEPLRLLIRPLPAGGRPPDFLGGVGRLEVGAELRPASARVGQPSEFRVMLTGPGAVGSTARPGLAGKALDSMAIRVEPLPDEFVDEPPRRVVRWKLRPGRPGVGVLPPVAVAYFDPLAERYFTKASQGVSLKVEDLPRFGPGEVRYGPEPDDPWRRVRMAWLWYGAGAVGVAAAILIAGVFRRAFRRGRAGAGRLAHRLAARLDPEAGAAALARQVGDGLVEYLGRARGWPRGALTPAEAESGIREVTGDPELGRRSGRLVEVCDRIRYAGGPGSAQALAAEARGVFGALARVERPAGGTSGEAPRTAV